MFERFSEKAIKAIMLAQKEVRELNHCYVGTEAILLGLTADLSSPVSKLLHASGVTHKTCRKAVEDMIGRGTEVDVVEMPFTDRAKKALEAGWEIAREAQQTSVEAEQNSVEAEHLLLGLLAIRDCRAVEILDKILATGELKSQTLDLIDDRLKAIERLDDPEPAGQSRSSAREEREEIEAQTSQDEVDPQTSQDEVDPQTSQDELEPQSASIERLAKNGQSLLKFCSAEALDVIAIAHKEAQELGTPKVDLEHLLLGIVAEGNSAAAKALMWASGQVNTLAFLRQGIRELTNYPRGFKYIPTDINFSMNALNALEMAAASARAYGTLHFGVEQILLAILGHPQSLAMKAMRKLRLNVDELEITLKKALADQGLAKGQLSSYVFSVEDSETGTTIELSSDCVRVVMETLREAHRLGHNFICTEFLLLGLMSHGGGIAGLALSNCRADKGALRREIDATFGRGPGSVDLPVPSSANAKTAFNLAAQRAKSYVKPRVETEDLLYGLLEIPDCKAMSFLERCGVVPGHVVAEINKLTLLSSADAANSSDKQLPFTMISRNVLTLAKEAAHSFNRVSADSRHLLLGLLAEKRGLAAKLLKSQDVVAKEIREEICRQAVVVQTDDESGRQTDAVETELAAESEVSAATESVGESDVLAETDVAVDSDVLDEFEQIVSSGRAIAKSFGCRHVRTDHLLLALLATDCPATCLLRSLSIDVERLEKALRNANNLPHSIKGFSTLVPLSKQKGFERFSDEAVAAMMFAREEATRMGHETLDSQFLLLGICDERTNKGAERLRKLGVSLHDLRFEIENLTGQGGKKEFGSSIVFTRHVLMALNFATEAVLSNDLEIIGPEHLFAGVISAEDGPVIDLLKQLEIQVEKIRPNTPLELKLKPSRAAASLFPGKKDKSSGDSDFNMYDHFSEAAINVMVRAQEEARALSHEFVTPEHILLGLLGDQESVALKALHLSGTERHQVREATNRMHGFGKSQIGANETIPLDALSRKSLEIAWDFSRFMDGSRITSDDLLYGLLRIDSCIKLFYDMSVDYKNYKEIALKLIPGTTPSVMDESRAENKAVSELVSPQKALLKPLLKPLTDQEIDKLFEPVKFAVQNLKEHFNQEAIQAIRLATIEALRTGRNKVGTDHLLVGICGQDLSVAARVLKLVGVTHVELRQAEQQTFDVGSYSINEELPFSENAKRALKAAFDITRTHASSLISSEALLLGIVDLQGKAAWYESSVEECAGIILLRQLNVDLANLKKLTLERISSDADIDSMVEEAAQRSATPKPVLNQLTGTEIGRRFANFSSTALKVVMVAHELARGKVNLIGTEQLLLALLILGENKAGEILQQLGVTPDMLATLIAQFVGDKSMVEGDISSATDPLKVYTTKALQTFQLARSRADFVETEVQPEHLLLAMMSDENSTATIILEECRVNTKLLKEALSNQQSAIAEGLASDPANETVQLNRIKYLANRVHVRGNWQAFERRFSINLRTAVDTATKDCLLKNDSLSPYYLLTGLLSLPPGSHGNFMQGRDFDLSKARALIGNPPDSASATQKRTERDAAYKLAQQALLRSYQISRAEGFAHVQTQHLLLALLELKDALTGEMLSRIGLKPESVKPSPYKLKNVPVYSHIAPLAAPVVPIKVGSELKVADSAEKVIKLAREEAVRMGIYFVGTEHVLLGLIAQEDGVAAQILRSNGLELNETRLRVSKYFGHGDLSKDASLTNRDKDSRDIAFTLRTQVLLDFAKSEVERLQHSSMTTGHLLLGLLREGAGIGVQVLEGMKLNLVGLREATEAKLSETMKDSDVDC